MTECDPDVWYRLVACGTGTMNVSLCDLVNFDSDLAVYAGSCDGLTQVACNGDGSGCGGYTSLLSVNVDQGQTYYIRVGGYQGATGSGSMTVTGPGEPCDGGTIAFDFPDGRPDVVDPDGSTVIRLEITGDDSITPDPGSAAMYYLQDDSVMLGSLSEVADNVYDASFGPLQCLPLEYWFTVNDTEGTEYISSTFNADVYTDLVVVFEDDGESDAGWTVSGSATDGQWDRGIPVNCNRGDPPTDGDGSGQCWLTDNDSANSCNSDVDGGATTLTSPVLDASDPGTTISYTYWYSNDFGGGPNNDFFTIEASDDGGGSWQTVEVIGPAGPGGWITSTFSISSIAGLAPSDNFRLRFTAEDAGDGSVIEAGVDGVVLMIAECETTDCTGDLDGNGMVNVNDLLQLIGAWGNPYDVNDLLELIGAWGECP